MCKLPKPHLLFFFPGHYHVLVSDSYFVLQISVQQAGLCLHYKHLLFFLGFDPSGTGTKTRTEASVCLKHLFKRAIVSDDKRKKKLQAAEKGNSICLTNTDFTATVDKLSLTHFLRYIQSRCTAESYNIKELEFL